MPDRYFEKFPTITYANSQVKDITERVIFTDNTLKNPYVFYPYDLDHYERPDQFAYRYYNDQYYTWLLYMTNQITDPYYEWYLTQDQFYSFIEKKYGSLEIAQTKIKYYRNNWATSNTISVSYYDALPATLNHYWEEQYGVGGNLIGYSRVKIDTIVNTNNIRVYTVNNNIQFIRDEICDINFDGINTGKGQVVNFVNNTDRISIIQYNALSVNNKGYWEPYYDINNQQDGFVRKQSVYLQHTSGTTLANTTVNITANSFLHGHESNVTINFTATDSYANNFLPEEEVYFSPVTHFEYENEKNEANKTIQVLDQPYAKKISNILKGLLK